MRARRSSAVMAIALLVAVASIGAAHAGTDGLLRSEPDTSASPLRRRPLPAPAPVADPAPSATRSDPSITALPGAHAQFGTLGAATYQIEVPDRWNGRLVMWMHGFENLAPTPSTGPPDFRRYLVSHGIAWAASSFSSTSLIPSVAADETAALWDLFVTEVGRPRWTYVSGFSMGGWATHLAAQRYENRFDGALALCGAVGTEPALRIATDVLVAAAYVAGVTQDEFDSAPDIQALVDDRIRPALDDPKARREFENIVIALSGGPRPFARNGIEIEEATNLERGALVAMAGLAPPGPAYHRLGRTGPVSRAAFEQAAIQLPNREPGYSDFTAGMEVTGDLQMPLLTMHTTGDGQVPIDQARILRRRVLAAGKSERLVQRVVSDPGHCGFSTGEQEAAFRALVSWVERGRRPAGTSLRSADLRTFDRTFELQPRRDPADRRHGVRGRVQLRGRVLLDGAQFDAQWIGAVVIHNQLVTACNSGLPPIRGSRYRIAVFGAAESAGCGQPGSQIALWTYSGDQKLFSTALIPWPVNGRATADVEFSTADPIGSVPSAVEYGGEVYRADGRRVRAGARVEAFIGDIRCGVASIRSGSFTGYIMSIVGPASIPGCRAGATVTFRVDGQPAVETAVNSSVERPELELTLR